MDATQASDEYNRDEEEPSEDDAMEQDQDEDEEDGCVSVKKEDDLPDSDGETDKVVKPLLSQMNISMIAEDSSAPPRERWHDDASDDALSSNSGSEPDTEEDDDDGLAPSMSSSAVGPVQTQVDDMALTDAKPGLGAGGDVMEYDPDKLFDRLVVYFDTSANAEANKLTPSVTPTAEQNRADTAYIFVCSLSSSNR